jgi:hypothetical protein
MVLEGAPSWELLIVGADLANDMVRPLTVVVSLGVDACKRKMRMCDIH